MPGHMGTEIVSESARRSKGHSRLAKGSETVRKPAVGRGWPGGCGSPQTPSPFPICWPAASAPSTCGVTR